MSLSYNELCKSNKELNIIIKQHLELYFIPIHFIKPYNGKYTLSKLLSIEGKTALIKDIDEEIKSKVNISYIFSSYKDGEQPFFVPSSICLRNYLTQISNDRALLSYFDNISLYKKSNPVYTDEINCENCLRMCLLMHTQFMKIWKDGKWTPISEDKIKIWKNNNFIERTA